MASNLIVGITIGATLGAAYRRVFTDATAQLKQLGESYQKTNRELLAAGALCQRRSERAGFRPFRKCPLLLFVFFGNSLKTRLLHGLLAPGPALIAPAWCNFNPAVLRLLHAVDSTLVKYKRELDAVKKKHAEVGSSADEQGLSPRERGNHPAARGRGRADGSIPA